jgi:hypothetical protein
LNIDRLITYTAAEIAKAAGLREDQVTHRLRHGLGVAHGIGQNRAENGVITIVLPDGVPAEALIAGEAKAAVSRGPRARRSRSRAPRGLVTPTPASAMDLPSPPTAGFFVGNERVCLGAGAGPAVTPGCYPRWLSAESVLPNPLIKLVPRV